MSRPPRRSGFTLLEVCLVLALIVMVSAVAYPTVDGMYSYYKANAGADTVRTALARARAKAIEDGRPYRFSIGKGSGRLKIAPDDPAYWGDGEPPASDDPAHAPLVLESKLPKGVRFGSGDSADHADHETPGHDSGGSADYSTVAVFLPDGSADVDVEITIRLKNARPITLKLRSLTGTVRTVDAAKGER
jgi:prepilin-type N-terminal cleavage/methylation domain-containing protein